ncbi:phytochrome sensor protein [Pseudomonas nabeulensis]|uniref:Phytochrome sensor protein n=2 Tax=Pseudomonas nabeulensis TaxID=2293833 RepID=A0A4Z0B6L9_9PSED|nr:phytochrome sensor protein [Pseudomonas nabeulensis]
MRRRCSLTTCMMVISLLLGDQASAGIIITGTRHIYPERQREITIQLTNDDRRAPRLVKAWLERGDSQARPESSDVPFSLSPPVFRIDAGKGQAMRLVYTREPLPADRESLFWLNVLEVPPRALELADENQQKNLLRFAFRIRTKVFFRPAQLPGTPEDAVGQLSWTLLQGLEGTTLQVSNASAYHITFNEIALAMGPQPDASLVSAESGMVPPGATVRLAIQRRVSDVPANAQVHFKYINDFGAFSAPQRAALKF